MELPPREGLALIGRTYLSVFKVPGNVAIIRIMVGEAIRFPQIAEMFYKQVALAGFWAPEPVSATPG